MPFRHASRPLRLYEVWLNGQKPSPRSPLFLRVYLTQNVVLYEIPQLIIPHGAKSKFWEWACGDRRLGWNTTCFPDIEARHAWESGPNWVLEKKRDHAVFTYNRETQGKISLADLQFVAERYPPPRRVHGYG